MRYLLSEVEFFLPTLEEYSGHVVVIRKDQLDGERLFVAPKDLLFASANFGSDEGQYKVIDHFADIVIFIAKCNGLNVSFDSKSQSTLQVIDETNNLEATLCTVHGKYVLITDLFTKNFELVRDFIQEHFGKVSVLTSEEDITAEPLEVKQSEKDELLSSSEEGDN